MTNGYDKGHEPAVRNGGQGNVEQGQREQVTTTAEKSESAGQATVQDPKQQR